MLLKKKKKKQRFHSDRRGLYAKESNAPQTLCAEIEEGLAGPKQPAQKQQPVGDSARGGQRVPASLQAPDSGPNGKSMNTP